MKTDHEINWVRAITSLIVLSCAVLGLAWLVLFGWPMYSVWASEMRGKAKLKEAEHTKQILIETARAEMEAAKLQAEAIRTVGQMSQQYPEYREQQFISAFGEALQSGEVEQIIYVPTEAGIPIVEAKRSVR